MASQLSGVAHHYLESNGVSIVRYQPWQFGLFHADMDGKMVWYPRKGTLMYETDFGITKLGEFHEVEEVWKRMHAAFRHAPRTDRMEIFCTGCDEDVMARLTNGAEMYPARPELSKYPFWVCDKCGAFVGTHRKTKDHLRPLGSLATKEVKLWRMRIHQVLDPLWRSGKIERTHAYARITQALGHPFHAGEIYDTEEGEFVYNLVMQMKKELDPSPWNR